MKANRFLWLIDLTRSSRAANGLPAQLPADIGLVPVDVDATWVGPPRKRPFGVVVAADGGLSRIIGALERIRRRTVLPIAVFVEGVPPEDQHRLLRAGSMAVLRPGWHEEATESFRARARLRIRRTLELMEESQPNTTQWTGVRPSVVAIGSSTGGPDALRDILGGDETLAVPVVIAQHVSEGFDVSLATWLTEQGQPCRVAEPGAKLEPGLAWMAPATQDLLVKDGRCVIRDTDGGPVPSADRLFQSVAQEYGRRAVGILLTGMGSDGAKGLLALQHAGGFTVTQRGDTCVVDGMPASARALHAQLEDWSPEEIRGFLDTLRTGQAAAPSA